MRARTIAAPTGAAPRADGYKWIALSNTVLANLIVTIDMTIVLIGIPAIFRGIHVDPLAAGNTKYMLWLILGFTIVTAVLVVSLGRLGDIYGRVRVYNLGFVVFTTFSILLSVSWMHGGAGARWLIAMLLAGIIAPCEELFWRGLVFDSLAKRYGRFRGGALASVFYGAVHLGSRNLTLTGAAGIGGAFWGLQYAVQRRLPALIVSHIVFDVWTFLIAPTSGGQSPPDPPASR